MEAARSGYRLNVVVDEAFRCRHQKSAGRTRGGEKIGLRVCEEEADQGAS